MVHDDTGLVSALFLRVAVACDGLPGWFDSALFKCSTSGLQASNCTVTARAHAPLLGVSAPLS